MHRFKEWTRLMEWTRAVERSGLRAVCVALLAVGLASCASVTTTGPTGATAQRLDPAIVEAQDLARQQATVDPAKREENTRAIQRLIAGLDNDTLSRNAAALPAGDPLYLYVGQALLRRGLPLPRPFERGGWSFDAGNRPPAERDGYRPPVKLAVLLPLSGSLAPAAAPVRDGFLTGYYAESRHRPEVSFYDTAGTPAGATAAYQRALAEGNDFVLGPLGRDEVAAVYRDVKPGVSMLALNRVGAPPAGAASFSLSPEDDGIAAAEFLLARNARRVLVLTGSDDGMRRAAAALRDALAARGGAVVDSLDVGGDPLTLLPRLQASVQKAGAIDAVFLAMRANEARAVAPLLPSAGLAGKPRVATSQLLAGVGKASEDVALDGIVYPTEPWTARGLANLPSAASVAQRLKTARGPAARLFAFGHDAWLITAYLEKLALDANGQLNGATGTLRLDGVGNVLHTPTWSTFSGGYSVPLPDTAAR